MRKTRMKYKVSGRLGYNAIMRIWTGKKKKWEDHVMYSQPNKEQRQQNQEEKNVRNPVVWLKNEDLIGKTHIENEEKVETSRRRRKDIHGRNQNQKRGRKRIYGGVNEDRIGKNRKKERKKYKEWKQKRERNYRKGRARSELDFVKKEKQTDQVYMGDVYQKEVERKKQEEQTHRIADTERRTDVRRWRSGRVPSVQIARDLIEHDYISRVNAIGKTEGLVKWASAEVRVGEGRRINEDVWKKRKERSIKRVKKNEYHMTAAKYLEVDYVTGMRVVFRKPKSGEVVIPMGLDVSLWSYL